MVICWFGLYDPEFSRNRIYMRGLRTLGHEIIECRDSSSGLLKFWRLYKKHRSLRGKYDVLIVGFPGHVMVPFARLISDKRIVADLLGSLSDAGEHSHHHNFWHRIKNRLVDRLAVRFAHTVLLETRAQLRYFTDRFGQVGKYRVLYTGVDESMFYCVGEKEESAGKLLILFRGALKPESGVMHILEAAKLLQNNPAVRFRIIGTGFYASLVRTFIAEHNLPNIEFFDRLLSFEELRHLMCEAQVSLGQLELHTRLDRTIPHKAFESMHMGLMYITADAGAIREIYENEVSALFVPPADQNALIQAIQRVAQDSLLRHQLARKAKDVYNERYSSGVLAHTLERILTETNH